MTDSVVTATHEHTAQVSLLFFYAAVGVVQNQVLFIILMVLKVLKCICHNLAQPSSALTSFSVLPSFTTP